MSIPIVLPEPEISASEIESWLRKYKLKKTTINITKATNALRAEKQFDSVPAGRDVSVIGSDATRRVIYGECKVGGTIVFIDSRGNNQYIDVVVAIATHEINAVTEFYVGEARVIFQSGNDGWSSHLLLPDGTTYPALNKIFLRVATGADDQFAIGDLIGQNPAKWTWDHKLSGVAHAYIILEWDGIIFGDGLPEFSFRVQGKIVYDSRPGIEVWRYTATTSLVIADYLSNTRFGLGVPFDRIKPEYLWAGADTCDDEVPIQGGGWEYRYAVNGYFDVGESHGRILERLAANFGGHITYSNGYWYIWPAVWRFPALNLTEDDLRSSLKIQTLTSRDDIFNAVRGTYVDASRGYIVTDYPAVKNSTYAEQDGEEIFENIDMHFVTSAAACQRLAKIELERIRQGIQIEALFSLKAYQLQVPDTVTLTIDRYGWVEKEFEVTKCDFVMKGNNSAPELMVALSLRETAELVFNWNYWEEVTVDLAPNTNLPSPFSVPTLSGLTAASGTAHLYKRGDGTIAPRIKVSWTALTDFFVTSGGFIEVQYRIVNTSDWIDAPRIPGASTFTYLSDVQDGQYYQIRARGLNVWETGGPWTSIEAHLCLGKTEKPTNVSGFAAAIGEYGIEFAWQSIPDLDLSYYEIREGATWATGVAIAKPKDVGAKIPIRAAGSYMFKIKAFDTSMNESTTEAVVMFDITAPMVDAGSFSFKNANVVLDWEDAHGGSWAVEDYTISYGATFGGSTFLAKAKTSQYSLRADWSGLRKFWVVPNDIYANAGTPFSFDVSVAAPGAVTNLLVKIVDNNVLLSWDASAEGSLPIDHYQIRKGATLGSSVEIGVSSATYATLFETISGDFIYWIVPVDTAGNEGAENYVMATVDQPPDFSLLVNETLVLADADVLTNVYPETDGSLLLPVNKTETWTEHFTDNSWATPQDQIDDGYPIFIQPAPTTAQYTQTLDIGTLITTGSAIRIDVSITDIDGALTITPTLSVSPDNSAWTDYVGTYNVFEDNFRYIKLNLDAVGDGVDLSRINSITITVSIKLKRDSGSIVAKASDATGTTITFNKDFYDIVGPPQVTASDIILAAEMWGTGNYLNGGDQADFEPGNGDFSIAGWVKFSSADNYPALAHKFGTANEREYILHVDSGNNNQLTFSVSASGTGTDVVAIAASNFGRVVMGEWIFVCCWHNAATDVIGIRVNRLTAQTKAFASGIFAGTRTGTFQIGGRSDQSSSSLNGQLKNWSVWKGRVLSSGDIDELYDEGFQAYSELSAGMKTSMVGFWEMTEASGTRDDAHTSNHDLSVTGTVGSRTLPLVCIADFVDSPDPTDFKALVFTDNQVRVSANVAWYADGYAS